MNDTDVALAIDQLARALRVTRVSLESAEYEWMKSDTLPLEGFWLGCVAFAAERMSTLNDKSFEGVVTMMREFRDRDRAKHDATPGRTLVLVPPPANDV